MRVSRLFHCHLKNNHLINDLKIDSREVLVNDIFYAIKGVRSDGNEYILSAIDKGAKTIVSEKEWELAGNFSDVNFIIVDDVRKTLAMNAKVFFQDLSASMTLIGVTGTNGKTTITTLLYKYFQFLHKKATLIGTNGIYITSNFYSTNNTTPDILEIYRILKESKQKGAETVIMEVSSHAVKMLRVFGLEFKVALITNLTQDHLDFHKTMEDYKYTKGLFLHSIKEENTVFINKDIEDFRFFYPLSRANTYTYGIKPSDYRFSDYRLSIEGSEFDLTFKEKTYHIRSSLLGIFNIYNIVSFVAITDSLGIFSEKTLEFLNSKINILGRMEVFPVKNRFAVIDFAHTPDGVENVLKFLNEVKLHQIFVVIGCGGDRDRGKRRIIGDIVTRYADFVIFTNDNPRTEDPNAIIADILEGVTRTNYKVILDRKMAIEEAFQCSLNNDIIAILGKGNEQYQIFGYEKIPFSDKLIIEEMML